MRRGKLEHLVTTGKFEGKRSRGKGFPWYGFPYGLFDGHVMRRGKLEHLVTTGKFEGKRRRERQREKIMDGLATWHGPGKVSDILAAVKDRDLYRDMTANAYKQGT
ncbi:LOW QUALITY PROTEIN: hypothetical protein PoB_004613800 [Plakobranchus ocellatus]|uniref:Uncharacterized protein n=1 Tax=Plakobranchus ocellatus TaxID=259542 RepID=A0AAV4BLD5_9GAST|nr:LOW QUALITY PROTEIN: hypothetical protein PoB_004613800 [Plakobranchus ocellatus]